MKTEKQHILALEALKNSYSRQLSLLTKRNSELQAETQRCQEELEFRRSQLKQHHENYAALERLLSTTNTECDKLRKLLVVGETSYNAEQLAHNATKRAMLEAVKAVFAAHTTADNALQALLQRDDEEPADE